MQVVFGILAVVGEKTQYTIQSKFQRFQRIIATLLRLRNMQLIAERRGFDVNVCNQFAHQSKGVSVYSVIVISTYITAFYQS